MPHVITRLLFVGGVLTWSVSAESGKKVEWLSEDNLMFSLETQEEKLKAWLENGPIIPEERAREVGGCPDLRVSFWMAM